LLGCLAQDAPANAVERHANGWTASVIRNDAADPSLRVRGPVY
jgi:hypothetical protein